MYGGLASTAVWADLAKGDCPTTLRCGTARRPAANASLQRARLNVTGIPASTGKIRAQIGRRRGEHGGLHGDADWSSASVRQWVRGGMTAQSTWESILVPRTSSTLPQARIATRSLPNAGQLPLPHPRSQATANFSWTHSRTFAAVISAAPPPGEMARAVVEVPAYLLRLP
ncbi:hypothetical protein IW261DRAFT_1426683 [Armillaria novae-zelandiae]|uniref:Uncharacterized protein n=1 Tax=Armillaria novae-zelandiae TaxID=153914 RepID=A0AA39NJ90_9AGAR|nr:hypothetical protein IW261DRAFT_1426683 [Armillaria novae-zelandiae]